MTQLTPQQRASRLRLDWQIVQAMNGRLVQAVAYRSTLDLEKRRNPITAVGQADQAVAYRVEFHVPTLAGRGKPLQPTTTVCFDLSVANYPYAAPASWIEGSVPYSPHFRQGAPVCSGEIWAVSRGKMLFGQLLIHVAKLLNWDEESRGPGYVGWNGDAIQYHRERYGGRPLDPHLRYPQLPTELTHGLSAASNADALFGPASTASGTIVQHSANLFGPVGTDAR